MKATRVLLAVTALAIALLFPPTGGFDEAKAIIPGGGGPTPPNFSFDSGAYRTGTPPQNHDFETGDLTGWTLDAGSASVESGGAEGWYLKVSPNSQVTSASFTIASDAQEITDLYSILDGSMSYSVRIVFSDHTDTLFNGTCSGTGPTPWTLEKDTIESDKLGETAQISVVTGATCAQPGYLAIDSAGVMNVVFSKWTVDAGVTGQIPPERRSDGPWGDHARLRWGQGFFWSDPFVVPLNATSIDYRRKCETPDAVLFWAIKILTGPDAGLTIGANIFGREYCNNPGETDWHTVHTTWLFLFTVAGEQVQMRFLMGAVDPDTDLVRLDEVGFNLREELETQGIPPTTAGDPFQVTTGALTHSHTDIAIPGRGVPLEFTRYYNSQSSYSGTLGYRWNHTYSMSLEEQDDDDVIARYDSGGSSRFGFVALEQPYTSPSGNRDTLVKHTDGTFTLTTTSQIDYEFDSSGRLDSIADRNGNTTNLYYDVNGRLDYVEDPGLRRLTF